MKQKQALKMRAAINALFQLTDPDRYCVAIVERWPKDEYLDAEYELHLYVRDEKKSGIVDLACLSKAIENLGTQYNSVDSTYDAGTKKGEDIRNSVKIW